MTPERLAKLAAEAAQTGQAIISKAEVAGIIRLKVALADAIHRPMGVIPASAKGLLSHAELLAAQLRLRPRRQPTPTGDA